MGKRLVYWVIFGSLLLTGSFLMHYSDLKLNQVDIPILQDEPLDLSRCCSKFRINQDVCGNSTCLESCPIPKELDIPDDGSQLAFYHETSGSNTLTFRQACSIESLAVTNPNLTIYVLMVGVEINQTSPNIMSLKNYTNIHIKSINLEEYIFDTPLESWYFCTNWREGPFAVYHLSDALRFLTLYKYGGYYFDLDIIFITSVEPYKNFIAAQDTQELAAGAFHVDYGHPVIQMAVVEFYTAYQKDAWAHNGPYLLQKVMQRFCQVTKASDMKPDNCHGFTILPSQTFYPIGYGNWQYYFKKNEFSWGNDTLGLHVWSKLSTGQNVSKWSDAVYPRLARTYCPSTFLSAPETF